MTNQKSYLYIASNMMGCILGTSNFSFQCVIYADSKEDARSWGIEVATRYAARFGLPPQNLNPDRDEIIRHTYVMERDARAQVERECVFGSYPPELQ